MAIYIEIGEFLKKKKEGLPIIDVRSPAEYAHAHLPGALNVPLFDNEERSIVGTIYKKQSKVKAVQKGLEFVGPKLKDFTKQILKLESEELLVHCWRGGMRSGSMAWLLEMIGLKVYVLIGGYKAYRNHVLSFFSQDFNLLLLGGCTGSGKTDLLPLLKKSGEQVVDLEQLANHKGSAFGAIGQIEQPSSEHFEHLLFDELCELSIDNTIWIEDESRNIGRVFIPQIFFQTMRESPLLKLNTSYEVRLERIMRDYACFDVSDLANSIRKIEKRLGYDKCKIALRACENGEILAAARICLDYYDKLYNDSLSRRFEENKDNYFQLELDNIEFSEILPSIIEVARECERRQSV